MAQFSLNRKLLSRWFFTIFLPLLVIVVLCSWVIYYFQYIKTQEDVLRAEEVNSLKLQKEFVQFTIKSIVSDIKVIAADQDLNDLINQRTQRKDSRLTTEFLTFSKYKGIYDQIRVLDNYGRETIRIDLRGDKPFLVPSEKLQFKGKRYYFKDINKLKKGEIYMSRLDLNIERGRIERPLKPMIRFGMPLFSQEGKKRGVVILNYLAKKLINDLYRLSLNSPGHLMLLNSEGYWLKGMQPEDEWGFMFKARSNRNMVHRYPVIWKEILHSENGQILTKDGLITFIKIYPLKEGLKSSSGSAKPDQQSTRELSPDEYFWVLISRVLPNELHEGSENFVAALILVDSIMLVMLGFVSWQLILANEKRRLAEEALKQANQELEGKVKQRTEELLTANLALKKEAEERTKAIDEKMRVESRLRQAQKMEAIGTLAGGIAHDFNNILTPILGYAEMVITQLNQDSLLHNDMNEILAAAQRAKDLVRQILTFSRQTEQELIPLKIQLVIKEALKLLRASIPTTIEIHPDIDPDCGAVLADPTQIHQIIMNLYTNAYHAMSEKGGVLGISLSEIEIGPEDYQTQVQLKAGHYLKLEVSDTGYGVPRELQETIFEPYFTTKEKGEGTGLGLSVVHGIIQKLHGHIAVYSGPGQGTTFRIYLPTVEPETAAPHETTTKKVPKGTEKILVVDDEESVLQLERRILENLGYKVTGLTSSEEAIKVFQAAPNDFDLVITDMTMPKMTGTELVKKFKEYRPDIPTILCTGYSERIDAEKAKDLGISGYITKPAALHNFARIVRDVLDDKAS